MTAMIYIKGQVRLCQEIVHQVHQVWPQEKPLFVRLSCTDWAKDLPQTICLCWILKQLGADVIDCSSGGLRSVLKMASLP